MYTVVVKISQLLWEVCDAWNKCCNVGISIQIKSIPLNNFTDLLNIVIYPKYDIQSRSAKLTIS